MMAVKNETSNETTILHGSKNCTPFFLPLFDKCTADPITFRFIYHLATEAEKEWKGSMLGWLCK